MCLPAIAARITAPQGCAVARYQTDGSLDPSFSDDGKKLTEFRGDDGGAYTVVIQENGKAVAAGYIYADKDRDFALARYKPDSGVWRNLCQA